MDMDIYLSSGSSSEANEYTHDFKMKVKAGEIANLHSDYIPLMNRAGGYTISVFMHGLIERENLFL